MEDRVGAFVPHGLFELAGATTGPLAGRSFAAKDIIDVAGRVSGCGNPDWLRTHDLAPATATTIQRCLDAGATLRGKTVTEELATGLTGENAHYGTPLNANAPGHVSGGSSSGSASAVAAGLVDFALGSDTGGSVRAPASFCGIYGIRPTHGRVPMSGVMPLAPSLDVVGWFARTPDLLAAVSNAILDGPAGAPTPGRFLVAADVFALLDVATRSALEAAIAKVEGLLGGAEQIDLAGHAAPSPGLANWAQVARGLWGGESWEVHREWVETVQPTFGSGVAARFAARALVTPEAFAQARRERAEIEDYLDTLLADGAVLAVPAGPGVPPRIGGSDADIDPFRAANEPIGAIAGLGRLPQVVVPLATLGGLPLGLGLAAAKGNDELLLGIAVALRDAGVAADVEIPQ
jgi:amidase